MQAAVYPWVSHNHHVVCMLNLMPHRVIGTLTDLDPKFSFMIVDRMKARWINA